MDKTSVNIKVCTIKLIECVLIAMAAAHHHHHRGRVVVALLRKQNHRRRRRRRRRRHTYLEHFNYASEAQVDRGREYARRHEMLDVLVHLGHNDDFRRSVQQSWRQNKG
jgi:hypothetical protein